jgi:SAM-dependent methyltransferase
MELTAIHIGGKMVKVDFDSLSDESKQILDAMRSLEIQPGAVEQEIDDHTQLGDILAPTAANIRRRAEIIQRLYFNRKHPPIEWESIIINLIDSGFALHEGDTYTLTETGRHAGQLARGERIGRRFSDELVRYESSAAHSEFCQRVFGIDLSQADLMDKDQLNILLDALALTGKNRVLDLACGIGRVAEYISDTTGANVLGIDVATDALERARRRTADKRHRLDFQPGNMDLLDLPPAGFDTVIAIASIHYAQDIANTIGQLKQTLTPDGQMALFSFQYQREGDPPEILLPENTTVGRALKQHGFQFRTWDFTDREIAVRRKQVETAYELMEQFAAEGNRDLAEDRIEECDLDLPRLEAGTKRRYLFHAHL